MNPARYRVMVQMIYGNLIKYIPIIYPISKILHEMLYSLF